MREPPPSTSDGFDRWVLPAAAFAARVHRHQLRKDGRTPYYAHVVRVAMVLRHQFGVTDPQALAAALLHDTIEDTVTDYDELAEQFGPTVAEWVAALTKDARLPEPQREEAYCRQLAAAAPMVRLIKLADMYDNLCDVAALSPQQRRRTAAKLRRYLEVVRHHLPAGGDHAVQLVAARLAALEQNIIE